MIWEVDRVAMDFVVRVVAGAVSEATRFTVRVVASSVEKATEFVVSLVASPAVREATRWVASVGAGAVRLESLEFHVPGEVSLSQRGPVQLMIEFLPRFEVLRLEIETRYRFSVQNFS